MNCPICAEDLSDTPEVRKYRPFCSRRCADLDLARWLNGDYAVPGRDGEADPELMARTETGLPPRQS